MSIRKRHFHIIELTRVIADSMNEMTSGAIQISKAVEDVNKIIQKNKVR